MDHYERFVNANDAAKQKVVPFEKGEHVYRYFFIYILPEPSCEYYRQVYIVHSGLQDEICS